MTPLSMDDFASIYDRYHQGRKARTLPMDRVFDWVSKSPWVVWNEEKDEFYFSETYQKAQQEVKS